MRASGREMPMAVMPSESAIASSGPVVVGMPGWIQMQSWVKSSRTRSLKMRGPCSHVAMRSRKVCSFDMGEDGTLPP